MNDPSAHERRSEKTSGRRLFERSTEAGREPSVEEIVQLCREVAAATGFLWIHDLVLEELERLNRRFAA